MLPPCFRLAERVYPLVRQQTAHRMAESGHTQTEIAGRLGVSQAMVSKYLKAGPPDVPEEDQWIVVQMAEELSQQLPPPGETTNGHDTNPWCRTLYLTVGEDQQDRRHLVASLLEILGRIREAPLAAIVPAVGLNLAAAPAQARERDQVASFPGRLAYIKGCLRAHAPPEFGASRHLAQTLIQAQRDAPGVRFVANLKASDENLKATKRLEPQTIQADGEDRSAHGVARFTAPGDRFALVDPGGFGIEPALYLIDREAGSLAKRIERLAAATATP